MPQILDPESTELAVRDHGIELLTRMIARLRKSLDAAELLLGDMEEARTARAAREREMVFGEWPVRNQEGRKK